MTSLITSSLNFCVLQKRLWRLCFSPKVRLFQRFSKTLRNCTCIAQRSFPRKVLVPINTRGAPLTPGCRGSLHTLFILWPVQGTWALCSVFLSQNKDSSCCVLLQRRHRDAQGSRCPGSCQGAARACGHSEPCHRHCTCAAASAALVFLPPVSPCLKRLQLYWSVMLHPGLKEVITKCFWLPNLFLRGINLSKSSLIVVFTWTLWSRRSLIAELFKIQKACSIVS